MKPIAQRCRNLQPSLTVSIDSLAKQLQAQGVDIISLGAGEPDFDTPALAAQAGIQAIEDKKTHYTSPDGLLTLKEAVCRKLARDQGLTYSTEQVIISSGAKHCIHNALAALVEPGDEVLIPTPHWVTYPELVRYFGGVPVNVPCYLAEGFRLDPHRIAAAITPRTKAILLNSPCNPTGAMCSQEDLQAIAELLERHNLYCISDEIYEHIAYSRPHISIAAISPEAQKRTLVINGVSKAYAMTGWRIGYTAAAPEIASALARLQGQTTHHPSNIAQYAAIAALDSCGDSVQHMSAEFCVRRGLVVAGLRSIPGLIVPEPEGAFYAFPSVEAYLGRLTPEGERITDTLQLAHWLLNTHGLALVPGAAFGDPTCLRLSFAADRSTLQEALRRLSRGLGQLRVET